MIEDSQSLAAIYTSYLCTENYDLLMVDTLKSALDEWIRFQPDLVLLDVELPDGNGLDLLKNRPAELEPADVIVMTAYGSSDSAVNAMTLGAVDYLSKPFDGERLKVTVANALNNKSLRDRVDHLSSLDRGEYCDFIGSSMPMQSLYRIIDSVASSDATAFIVGESGTGKELTASAIHQMSKRSENKFLALNCGAIPGELIESELFGHVKGAFTGAINHRDGAASISDGGTLFLDEICEMDLELQTKMLRFIQTGEFQRVGSNKTEKVDVRFVCATNKDPLEEVRSGRFREDLFYRLHVIPIKLPPLRERGEDILEIAGNFLKEYVKRDNKQFSGFSPEAETVLLDYAWPGNVRELQNVIQQAVVLNDGTQVLDSMLIMNPAIAMPAVSGEAEPKTDVQEISPTNSSVTSISEKIEIEPLWQVEKRVILHAVEVCDGNVNRAAGLLEVAPSTIYRKLNSWESKTEGSSEDDACTA